MALFNTNIDPFGRPLTAQARKRREKQRANDLAHASASLKKSVAALDEKVKNAPPMTDAEEYALLQLLDQPLMVHRAFIEVTGSLAAGAILGDLSDRCRAEHVVEDWVFVDAGDWRQRLGLSEAEQHAALALLRQRQFIQVRENPNASSAQGGGAAITMMRIAWVSFERGVREHAEQAVQTREQQRPALILN